MKGQVEKGPFVSGSAITMQSLNDKLQAVGSSYTSTITDDEGSFAFNPEQFEQPYARLSVMGYFYNEYKGELSQGQIMLQSVVDLQDKNTVNVNLLTHLKYQRVMNLASEGKTYAQANEQAQRELLTAFGLQRMSATDASQFSVAAGTDEAGALIAVSALLLGNRSEAEFTEYMARLCSDFADDGEFSETNKEQIATERENIYNKLETISKQLKDRYLQLGRTIAVKPLENYFDWDDNGTAGDEAHDPLKPVELSQSSLQVPMEGGTYEITFKSDVTLYTWFNGPQGFTFSVNFTPAIKSSATVTDANTLKITVEPTTAKSLDPIKVSLYDYFGNTAATIEVSQEGDPDGSILNDEGKRYFERIKQALYDGNYKELERIFTNDYNHIYLSFYYRELKPEPVSYVLDVYYA